MGFCFKAWRILRQIRPACLPEFTLQQLKIQCIELKVPIKVPYEPGYMNSPRDDAAWKAARHRLHDNSLHVVRVGDVTGRPWDESHYLKWIRLARGGRVAAAAPPVLALAAPPVPPPSRPPPLPSSPAPAAAAPPPPPPPPPPPLALPPLAAATSSAAVTNPMTLNLSSWLGDGRFRR